MQDRKLSNFLHKAFLAALPTSGQQLLAYAALSFAAAIASTLTPTYRSVDVMDVEKEALKHVLLHKRVYKKKRVRNKFLTQCRPCMGFFFLFIGLRRLSGVPSGC